MRLLQLLKQRTGAISGTRALVAGVMLTSAALTIHSYFQRPTEPDQAEVRRVADLMAQHADLPPEYASIEKSFSLGRYNGQFADAEEKAKYNGDITIGSDSADALESGELMGQVFSGHNGLGLGDKDVDVSAPGASGNVNDPAANVRNAIKNIQGGQGNAGGEGGSQTEGAGEGQSKVNKLASASITHAHGNNLSVGNSGSGTTPTEGTRVKNRPVNPTPVNAEENVISGAMSAGSSSWVKSNNRFIDPSYKPSQDDVKMHRRGTPRETTESDYVKRVTKISKRMALKQHKADNEAVTTSFMGAQETTVTYDTDNAFTKSDPNLDLSGDDGLNEDGDLGDQGGQTVDTMAEYNNKKSTAQNHLLNMCLGLLPMVMTAFFAISIMMTTARTLEKDVDPFTKAASLAMALKLRVISIILGVAIGLMVATYVGFAISFMANYTDAPGAGIAHTGIGALFLATIVIAFLPKVGAWGNKVSGTVVGQALGIGSIGGALPGGVTVAKEFIDAAGDGSFSAERPENVDDKNK